MSSEQRVIRVFVSSTFRDMQEDRDYLVKFVFPQLRKLCEARGVTWGEVDLRWGIPEEEVAEGRVLPLCLEEIHRCRPYFIGLLGERYGWIRSRESGQGDARPPVSSSRNPLRSSMLWYSTPQRLLPLLADSLPSIQRLP